MTIIATEFTAYANAQTTDEAVYAIKFTVPVPAIEEMELVAFIDISPSATTDIEPF